jgi:hypothetical protein
MDQFLTDKILVEGVIQDDKQRTFWPMLWRSIKPPKPWMRMQLLPIREI